MKIGEVITGIFDLQLDELPHILPHFILMDFPKGTDFLTEGKSVDKIGFIQQGITREYFVAKGKEITKYIGTPGSFISDVSGVHFNTPSRWTIRTVTDCKIYTFQKSNFAIIREALPRWSLIEKQFIAKCLLSAENRILEHLQLNAEERYLKLLNEKPIIFNYVELQHIASFLAMTPETLSRLRNKHSR